MGDNAKERERKAAKAAGKRTRASKAGKASHRPAGAGWATTSEPGGPFTRLLGKAIRQANALGLYILAEGDPQFPVWRVYSRRTGSALLVYVPHTRRWTAGSDQGTVKGFRDALELAAARHDKLPGSFVAGSS
jgi:hypothetical protein